MDPIWALILTVCVNNQCMTQTIDTYKTIQECAVEKTAHDLIPSDRRWQTVTYTCIIPGAKKI